MRLHAVGMTDIGNVRAENQDSFAVHAAPCSENGSSLLVVVADGVGGGKGGSVASRLAVESLRQAFLECAGEPGEVMRRGMDAANARILETADGDESCSGMATTCTALMVMGGSVTLGHVGDSRAYRIRDGEIVRLTEDHTLPRRLLKQGLITEEQVASHPQWNVLTNAVGSRTSLESDVFPVDMKERDTFVLCSDGMHKYLRDEEIAAIVRGGGMEDAPERLVATAKERGGDDNITVVVVHADGADLGKTTQIVAEYEPAAGVRPAVRGKALLALVVAAVLIAIIVKVWK